MSEPPAERPSAPHRPGEDEPDAAQAALARARAAAVAKGLRPGQRPMRRRGAAAGARTAASIRSGSGADRRDPSALGDELDHLVADRGWKLDVAAGVVMGNWAAVVGGEVATHAQPVSFEAGVLTVRAESTAWATQLRLLSTQVLGQIAEAIGPGQVTELRIVGPSAPSWKRGNRRSPDSRGPRDTYG